AAQVPAEVRRAGRQDARGGRGAARRLTAQPRQPAVVDRAQWQEGRAAEPGQGGPAGGGVAVEAVRDLREVAAGGGGVQRRAADAAPAGRAGDRVRPGVGAVLAGPVPARPRGLGAGVPLTAEERGPRTAKRGPRKTGSSVLVSRSSVLVRRDFRAGT